LPTSTLPPGRDRKLVTFALMLGSFLAAIEATAVATAVPTAVGELGGMSHFSWVFSAYLLASTTTVPLYGKLADLYGRRRVYHVSVALFLLGSALCGSASSLAQLVVYRAIQGLGAGGVQPITITLIGDIFTLEERGRVQGLFSGVWAVSSLLGPPLGGLITDVLTWRWIFYLNIPIGLASSLILQRYLREEMAQQQRERRLDLLGTVVLTFSVSLLLFALLEGGGANGFTAPGTWALFGLAGAGLALFVWQERRAADPMLPLDLFRSRVIAVSSIGSVLVGALLFAITAFVPMFSQGVLGGGAVAAGAVLTPMLLGWPIASVVSGRMVLRAGYRKLALIGGLLLVAGGLMLGRVGGSTTRFELMTTIFVIGFGVGFLAMPTLLAVQNSVPWQRRGVATSSVQFFRTIGGSIAVAGLGALLNARVARFGANLDPNAVFDPALLSRLDPAALAVLRRALLSGLTAVFGAMGALCCSAIVIALVFPRGTPRSTADREAEAAANRWVVGHGDRPADP
jgi:EmrB/QacA subfamily drug resistance transporter